MSDKSKPPIEEEARLTWPLSMGSEVEVATAFALTSIRGGHVLEIGRAILSGHAGRSTPEILELLLDDSLPGGDVRFRGSLKDRVQLPPTRRISPVHLEAFRRPLDVFGRPFKVVYRACAERR